MMTVVYQINSVVVIKIKRKVLFFVIFGGIISKVLIKLENFRTTNSEKY
jgi:hypothetical protein